MNEKQAINILLSHEDPKVRVAATVLNENSKRRKQITESVRDALSQIRLDMKYLVFDLQCTRRERDELIERLR